VVKSDHIEFLRRLGISLLSGISVLSNHRAQVRFVTIASLGYGHIRRDSEVPPTVHQMVLTLEARGFIKRIPGRARSIRLMIRGEDLPTLK